jgi:cytidylate kinase
MKRKPIIAIDGPAAAGKSTVARLVAERLGLRYLDSGAMYRALAWQVRRLGLREDDSQALAACCRDLPLRLEPGPHGASLVFVGDREISDAIRDPEIGELASRLSDRPEVRHHLVARQRELGAEGGIVIEGRDIQTVVFPGADLKVFLTASAAERARRRWLESSGKGLHTPLEEVRKEIEARDARDRGRRDSPLRAAPDAVTVDSDGLSIEQVVARIVARAEEKLGPRG